MENYKFYELLSKEFPNIQSASTELINLSAILNLPKGTEYFISDIHGEFDTFNHYIKNASGIIRKYINDIFVSYSEIEKSRLAYFIYYPTDMLNKYQEKLPIAKYHELIRQILIDMVDLTRVFATKYTQSKVRKSLPKEFSYVMCELIYESRNHQDKERYYEAIIDAIFKTQRINKLIIELSKVIRNLSIDRLHVIGDIFDRGPFPHLVMEKLIQMNNIDIQWGNHDIIWMGAASGCMLCISNVIRIAARYNNLDCLEDGYGINLRPLANFAMNAYALDDCRPFQPKLSSFTSSHDQENNQLVAKIHKAISIIQFKLERDLIKRNVNFNLDDRLLLDKIDINNGTINIDGITYHLLDNYFPTIDFNEDPYKLTAAEISVMNHLKQLFLHNEMLQKHIKFLFQNGSMYLKVNQTLLFHAAVILDKDGNFVSQTVDNIPYQGKALFDILEKKIRSAYLQRYNKVNEALDYFIFLWQGKNSPLFAKHAMKTFERYFIKDNKTHQEIMNPYYILRKNHKILDKIFTEFELPLIEGRIVNGHIPFDITKGDEVILADNRIYLIDGGMSKQFAYRTQIGGYTLISDSNAYYLVSHERIHSHEILVELEKEIASITHSKDLTPGRTYIYDTDKGRELQERVDDLAILIKYYREGIIKEKMNY